jgi:hypothetical protein
MAMCTRKENTVTQKLTKNNVSPQIEIYVLHFAFTISSIHISNHLQKSLLTTNVMANENTMMKRNNDKL